MKRAIARGLVSAIVLTAAEAPSPGCASSGARDSGGKRDDQRHNAQSREPDGSAFSRIPGRSFSATTCPTVRSRFPACRPARCNSRYRSSIPNCRPSSRFQARLSTSGLPRHAHAGFAASSHTGQRSVGPNLSWRRPRTGRELFPANRAPPAGPVSGADYFSQPARLNSAPTSSHNAVHSCRSSAGSFSNSAGLQTHERSGWPRTA